MTIRFASFLLVIIFAFGTISAQESPPNIVLIVADDMGYGDLGSYGAKEIKTPRLDKLAKQGARLTSFYSNGPECTPTRAALITGRYQQRVPGFECAIGLGNVGRYDEAKALSDKGQLGMPVEYSVLPKVLNENGYNSALFGKWHLGHGVEYQPAAHGFDYSIGPLGGAVDYFHHTEPIGEFIGTYMEGDHDLWRNGVEQDRTGYYLTHLLTDEAVEWINVQQEEKPFFLYLPYTVPHLPFQDPQKYNEDPLTMDTWNNSDRDTYIRMIEDLDASVGKILDKLIEKGFDENTLVIFFSDNGPTKTGSAGPYSGNKGHVFEGGIRVPCIIRWPGHIKSGTTSDQAFISMDLTASIAEIVDAQPEHGLDGIDLIGHISSGKSDYDRDLFWRKRRAEQVRAAVRSGNWKYIRDQDNNLFEEYLFDLSKDEGETKNLKDSEPGKLARMQGLLREWEGGL